MKFNRISVTFFVVITFLLCPLQCFCAKEEPAAKKIQPEKATKMHKIIRIHYTGAVTPETVTIKPGTTVVWINESKRPIEIQFQNKQVTLACKSPVHFVVGQEGSFISNRIPHGAVASLCFIETGTYKYAVRKVPSVTDEWHDSRQRITAFSATVVVKK